MEKLGAYTCPPHHNTSDPKTPSSFEPLELQRILQTYIDESTLLLKGSREELMREMKAWLDGEVKKAGDRMIAIKHPLLCLTVPITTALMTPKYVVIRRPYGDIDRTRARRNWPLIHGYLGARIMYEKMYSDLISERMSFHDIFYPDLLSDPEAEVSRLAKFSGLEASAEKLANAFSFVRR